MGCNFGIVNGIKVGHCNLQLIQRSLIQSSETHCTKLPLVLRTWMTPTRKTMTTSCSWCWEVILVQWTKRVAQGTVPFWFLNTQKWLSNQLKTGCNFSDTVFQRRLLLPTCHFFEERRDYMLLVTDLSSLSHSSNKETLWENSNRKMLTWRW